MFQTGASSRPLSPDDPVRVRRFVLLDQPLMIQSVAFGRRLSPDASVRNACSAWDVWVWGAGPPSSAFCCHFVSAAPSCFAPYEPVLGTQCPRLRLAACPRPCPGHFLTASPQAPPLCCFTASPRPRPLGCPTSSLPPRPFVSIAASPGPCPHLSFSASPRHPPPLRFAASPVPRPRCRFSSSPWPTILSVATGCRLSSDVPVRGAAAPVHCSVPIAAVRGVWLPLVP